MQATVPCGQCHECRLAHSRQWAMRCVHEAELHAQNTVITLTYSNDHLPENGSIRPEDAANFMKRLRAHEDYFAQKLSVEPRRFKTYGCGEYGDKHGRPHYHIILFGYDFLDKTETPRSGSGEYKYYTSDILDSLWGMGRTELMDLTWETAAYVARYCMKKLTGPRKAEYGNKLPEQPVCLSRKGIGKEWYQQNKQHIYKQDKVTLRGKEMKPAKYYDRIYEIENPEEYEKVKWKRKMKAEKNTRKIEKEMAQGNYTNALHTGTRCMANKICTEAKVKTLRRGYENDS